jgi:hypothetical protein
VEHLGSYGVVGNRDTGSSGVREINCDTFGGGVVVLGLQRNRRADIMMANLTNFFVGNRLGCAGR